MSVNPTTSASASATSGGMGAGPVLGILLAIVTCIVVFSTFSLFIVHQLRERRETQAKQNDLETSLGAAPPYCSHRFGSSETVVDEKRGGDFGSGGKMVDEKRPMDRFTSVLARPSAAFQPSKYDTDFSAEKARRPAYLNAFVSASHIDLHTTDPFADHTNVLRTKPSDDELRMSTAQTLRISAAGTASRSTSPYTYTYDGRHSEEQAPTYYSGSVAENEVDVPPMLPPLTLRAESSWNPFEHEMPSMSFRY